MPVELTVTARERSTYAVSVAFFDENKVAVEPNDDVAWTLSDAAGTVVNGKERVSQSPAAAAMTIVLSGLDLAVGDPLIGGERRLLVECTYDSDLGTGLPLKEEFSFTVEDFAVPKGTA